MTTHDVGVVTGKLCFDKGLCNVLPVFCNEHQAGHRCTDIFCDFKIVGEHSVAEQLTADPVWCAAGNIYNIIDSRYRSRKPLIVTTNLTLTELKNPQDTAHARIYDRLLELCTPIACTGPSMRKDIGQAKLNLLKTLLA